MMVGLRQVVRQVGRVVRVDLERNLGFGHFHMHLQAVGAVVDCTPEVEEAVVYLEVDPRDPAVVAARQRWRNPEC